MRVFLIIVGVLVLLNVLLCISHVVVSVRYWDGTFDWSIRYLGIKILPRKKSDKPPKPEKKKKKEDEPAEKRRDFLMDKLWKLMQSIAGKADLAGSAVFALPGPLNKLLRGITWYDIETDIVLGGEDAAETAQLYGKIQMILQPLLGAAAHYMKVKRKRISIVCDYTEDTSQYNAGCKFKLAVGTVLAVGIWLAWDFLMDNRAAKKTLVSEKL
ncbi:MAG: DUF2953 domain-containing protein [Oscillospiraceae bacterium]|nr:DUF2953 domain-containing protein [Oscillospiraceae bacterium]